MPSGSRPMAKIRIFRTVKTCVGRRSVWPARHTELDARMGIDLEACAVQLCCRPTQGQAGGSRFARATCRESRPSKGHRGINRRLGSGLGGAGLSAATSGHLKKTGGRANSFRFFQGQKGPKKAGGGMEYRPWPFLQKVYRGEKKGLF